MGGEWEQHVRHPRLQHLYVLRSQAVRIGPAVKLCRFFPRGDADPALIAWLYDASEGQNRESSYVSARSDVQLNVSFLSSRGPMFVEPERRFDRVGVVFELDGQQRVGACLVVFLVDAFGEGFGLRALAFEQCDCAASTQPMMRSLSRNGARARRNASGGLVSNFLWRNFLPA